MSKQLTQQRKKEWAQMLFLTHQYTQKEIAEKVGMHEVSLSRIIKKESWEKLRKSLLTTKTEILSFFYTVLDKLKTKINAEDGIGNSKDADMVVKYTAAIKSLETETSIAELMEAGRLFHKHLQITDPTFALKVLNHYDQFIKDRLKKF